MKDQCDIIILAAGSSSRLGSPKQLLLYNQETFLQHAINTALASVAQRVVVVLGANAQALQPAIKNNKLFFINNDQWQEGIASSIRLGLNYLQAQTPSPGSVLFMVCDQPFITTGLLNKLVALQTQTGIAIAASEYAGTTGIPAVFNKSLFEELLQLEGDSGAKKLIKQQKVKIVTVPFPQGAVDIDTETDYQDLLKM